MTGPATVMVLAKEPVPGRVKTRLCPPCTPEQAAEIARAAIADTLRAVVATEGTRPLLVLDGHAGAWRPRSVPVVPQSSGGLADRLAAAFAGVPGPAVLVGMDTPQVSPALLHDAVTTLRRPDVDVVLGLTADGGWWIIGFDRPVPGAFEGVPMSSPDTGRRQRARLDALGARVAVLPPAVDVDTFADARAVADAHPHLEFADAVRRVDRLLDTDAVRA